MNENRKRKLLLICLALFCLTFLRVDILKAQEPPADTTRWAIKTNLLGWATTSINLAGEVTLDERNSLNLAISYNPFTFADNRKWRHILVQPEWRYWTDRVFSGHFVGLHLLYTHYNAGNVDLPFGLWSGLERYRYQGDLVGAGLAYGYRWRLGRGWQMEASIGLGYGYTSYKKYECPECGAYLGKESRHLFMPTKTALSLIYVFGE